MCPPVLAVAAAAVTATGQVLNGIGQSQQYRYQAQVDDQNSRLASDQARDSIDDTNLEAQRRYRQLADTQGKQQAAMAANGVDLNFGSPADVQRDTSMTGAEDIGQIYKAGYQRTHGYDIDGWNSRSQAAASRAKASGALMQGIFSGLGSALGAASKFGGDGTPDLGKAKQGGPKWG
jgi:hypothetical protein